jgi:hypothetical protein
MPFWPMVPFVVLLGTRLRWGALAAAAAGIGVALPFVGFFDLDRVGICAAVSALMAVAEAVAATLALRGRFRRVIFYASFAHAAWLWILFGGTGAAAHRPEDLMFVLVTAMVGATGATLGAYNKL